MPLSTAAPTTPLVVLGDAVQLGPEVAKLNDLDLMRARMAWRKYAPIALRALLDAPVIRS